MKIGKFEIPPRKEIPLKKEGGEFSDVGVDEKNRFIRVPLPEEDKKLSVTDIANKYSVSRSEAYRRISNGFIILKNPDYVSRKDIKREKESFLEEVTPIDITSIENVINDPVEQETLKEIVDSFSSLKYTDRFKINQKKFKLLNGKEVFFSDLWILNKIFELKLSRNENGELFAQFDDKNIKFNPGLLSKYHSSFTFKNINKDNNKNNKTLVDNPSLETFAPNVFKSGFFEEKDFNQRLAGSRAYEIYGPHERTISKDNPYVFFSNSEGKCKYFLGRDKFVGTDRKINHETVRAILLDNNNVAITDLVHGKKVILYTFPLINRDEYEKKKKELDDKFKDKENNNIRYGENIVVGGKDMVSRLTTYKMTDYIHKNINESDTEYAERVSSLSDITYVLGNFRSFLSETGLAANNYSWKEQLILANTLTSVSQKSKIINFSNIFKKDGLRTFLSIEQGGKEMGDKILTLGEKLPESSARTLFKTYGEMIDASDEIGDLLKDELGDRATSKLILETRELLLLNGKNLLEKYSEKAKDCQGSLCEDIGKELEERLSLAKKSVFAFSTVCRVLVEKGEFSFEDFKKAKLSYDKSPLPEKIQEEITKMHTENTKQYPEKLKLLWRNTLKDGLENPNEKQLVVSATYEDNTVSTMRVIQQEDGSWYGASFNVNPTIQGSRIGTELLKEVLKNLAKDKPFVADCYSKNPMLETYLNRFGFKITKKIENYNDTGELVYQITIFPDKKKEN